MRPYSRRWGLRPSLADTRADSVEYAVETKIEGAVWVFGESARIKRLQQSRIMARFRLADHPLVIV
ncbi:MAG TPA: hypothetical protein VGM27_26515 [Acidobacteriaceae bacterium]